MNYLILLVGAAILVAVILDLLYTTFSPNGAGFLTNFITKGVYSLFRETSIRLNAPRLFEFSGVVIIVLILVLWYLMVWLGSSLILCSDPGSIVNSRTRMSTGVVEKFYYTGFTISTLGIGDYNASSNVWRIFTVLLSFTGFVLITTGISYMLPVLSATVIKRKLGSYIATLGESPQEILIKQWKRNGFKAMESHFDNIAEMILHHCQQLLAYPVIYCFYSSNPRMSAALNIAKLDEVLTILLIHIPQEDRPGDESIYPLREAIRDYLFIQKEYFIHLQPVKLGKPDLGELKKAGIPLMDEKGTSWQDNKELNDRRELMGSILKEQGRDYRDIYGERPDQENG